MNRPRNCYCGWQRKKPGCILLDMVMPGINGVTVKENLKRIGWVLPIVWMTGGNEPIQRGPEELLIKPISKEKLLDAIESALGIARTTE